jgi:N-acetylneuraminate lyase
VSLKQEKAFMLPTLQKETCFMKAFKGLVAAPVTPFKENGSINTEAAKPYAQLLKDSGVAGVFVNGTTGESYSLSQKEREDLAAAWTAEKTADFKVMIHVGATNHEESKALAAHAETIGADAIGEMGPLFFKPDSVAELVNYTAQTAAAAPNTPYFFYHMPAMNGINMPMIRYIELADKQIPTLAGIKFTYENLMDFELCRAFKNDEYNIMHGRDETLICGLALGATAAVGSTYNLFAPLYLKLQKAFEAGDLATARELQRLSMKGIQVMADSGYFFSVLRQCLAKAGVETGHPRSPLLHCEDFASIDAAIEATGIYEYLNQITVTA